MNGFLFNTVQYAYNAKVEFFVALIEAASWKNVNRALIRIQTNYFLFFTVFVVGSVEE